MDFIFLLSGIAGLWLGTELTIGGAVAIAKRHHLSEFFVGLVILSIGSDLPELAVAVDAGLKTLMGQNASEVVVGASIGSVVAQIGFVMGVAGLISILTLPREFIYRHGSVLLGMTALLFVLGWDGHISRLEGIVLVAAYTVYILALMNGGTQPDEAPPPMAHGGRRSWLALVFGLIIVIISSEVTVSSVVHIAEQFNISQALISVLIIGLGTSLPELSISISAILKKRQHLSVGNIIGSNILDTALPIGIAATIAPLTFDEGLLRFDLPYIFLITAIILALFLRKTGVSRPQGMIILALYFGYVAIKLSQF